MLHAICTQLCPGHLSVCVRDSLRRSEEIVKPLNYAFQSDDDEDDDDDGDDDDGDDDDDCSCSCCCFHIYFVISFVVYC